ncbi:YdcF family protein [Microbacterium sp. W4I4]|uniref:YdcF family protein n=1 Tax=Microbacterium sp. W4I4 TaxID=3042295 RepID=UPI0027D8C6E5|nr:YdcF family protein [Microbacterium sp. W4I4]
MALRQSVFIASAPVAVIGMWLWAELVDARASRSALGDTAIGRARSESEGLGSSPLDRTDAVVVLGYRNRGERANFVNRFRVRAGIRSFDSEAADSVLVLCGGPVGGAAPEAVLMQRYARDELHHTGRIILDTTSRSTWENIAHAIPHIEHATTVKIVSNAPHAELGRQILRQQRPDLAERLVRGAEHRFGEAPVLKILSALRAVQSQLSGAWRTAARAQGSMPEPARTE